MAATCLTVQEVIDKGGWEITTEIPDWEPFWFADEDGNFVGMDVDLLNEVNERLGIPPTEYNTVAWEGVMPATLAGTSDFLPEGIPFTAERAESFAYGPFFGDSGQVIMSLPDSGIKTTEDLIGHSVAVLVQSTGLTVIEGLREEWAAAGITGDVDLKLYQNITDHFIDLENGRVDAVIQSATRVAAYMARSDSDFYVSEVIEPAPAGWIFRKEDMNPGCIGDDISKLFADFKEEGLIAELQVKWFGQTFDLPTSY